MMKKVIGITAVLLVLALNYTPLHYLLVEDYTYANKDNTFTFSEEGGKGYNYESVLTAYAFYRCQHPQADQGDSRLYRTFTIKPWYIWEWHDMIFRNQRFWLPYKAP